jgi:arylsulfatase
MAAASDRVLLVAVLILLLSSLSVLHERSTSTSNVNEGTAAFEAFLAGVPLAINTGIGQGRGWVGRGWEKIEAELGAARDQIERLVKRDAKAPPGSTWGKPYQYQVKQDDADYVYNPTNFSDWPYWKQPFVWGNVTEVQESKYSQRHRRMWENHMTENATEDIPQRPYDPTKPMNVLMLYADDWRYDTLGAAGNRIVQTPTLDRLASEGVRFTENCVTTSVCWVSRVSMVSSQYLARHNTSKPKYFFVPWNHTVYDLMQRHGYHVGHVGKWGFNHDYKDRVDFSVEADGWHYTYLDGRMWQVTEKNEADALKFLDERPKDKPFFVNVAFFATHAVDGDKRQFLPQNKSMGLYRNDYIPYPENNDTYKTSLPSFFEDNNEGRTRWTWRYDSEEKQQHMMKNYYRMASEVDSACATILEEVRRQGELENTLIIFTTDNGNFHAEHGLADKWYPHQESIRVPLIIRDPRMPAGLAGTLNDDFTLNIDLAPTILGAAGVVAPPSMMGRDMSQLYLGTKNAQTPIVAKERYLKGTDANKWRDEFFYEHPIISHKEYIPSSEALVRKDYKYFYWPDYDVEQLFDMKNDPREENDISKSESAQVQKVLAEMRSRFQELKATVHHQTLPVIM